MMAFSVFVCRMVVRRRVIPSRFEKFRDITKGLNVVARVAAQILGKGHPSRSCTSSLEGTRPARRHMWHEAMTSPLINRLEH